MPVPSAKAVVSSVEVEDESHCQEEDLRAHNLLEAASNPSLPREATVSIMQSDIFEEAGTLAEATQAPYEATNSITSNINSNTYTIHTGYHHEIRVNEGSHCSYNALASRTVCEPTNPARHKTFQNLEVERTRNDPVTYESENQENRPISEFFLNRERGDFEESFANEKRNADKKPPQFNNDSSVSRSDIHSSSEFQSIGRPTDNSSWNFGANRRYHAGVRPKERHSSQPSLDNQWDGKLDSSSNHWGDSGRIYGPGSLANLQDRKQHIGAFRSGIHPRLMSEISRANKPDHFGHSSCDLLKPERNPKVNNKNRPASFKIEEDDDDINNLPTNMNDSPFELDPESNVNHNTERQGVEETEVPQSPVSDVPSSDFWNQLAPNVQPVTNDRIQKGSKAFDGLDVAGQNYHWLTTDSGLQVGIPVSDSNSGDSSVDQDTAPSSVVEYSKAHTDEEPRNQQHSREQEIYIHHPDARYHGGTAMVSEDVGARGLIPRVESRDEMEELRTDNVNISSPNSHEINHSTKNTQVNYIRDTSNRPCSSRDVTGVASREFGAATFGQVAGRSSNRAHNVSDGFNPPVSCMLSRNRPPQRIIETTSQPSELSEAEIPDPGSICAECHGLVEYLFFRGGRQICDNCLDWCKRLEKLKAFTPFPSQYRKMRRRCGHCFQDRFQMNWLECRHCGRWLCSQCCIGRPNCMPRATIDLP